MPIYATTEAKAFWEAKPARARALAAARFCHIKTSADGEENSYRKHHAEQLRRGEFHKHLLDSRAHLNSLIDDQGGLRVFAKLEGRLILNAAGGVVENGGICLDRNSGVPFIPGSAIKGAARRHAVWSLSQETDLTKKALLLKEASLLFGYGDQEWKPGRKPSEKHIYGGAAKSDFWLAMTPLEEAGAGSDKLRDENWNQVSELAKAEITKALGLEKFPKQLSGGISFLPAFPESDSGIDLDIITCHHPKYYKNEQEIATDDELPIPVVFPAIPSGASFQFPLLPCQSFANLELLTMARNHLTEALEIFGLGAKTNAGYGWFSIDHAAQKRADEKRLALAAAQERKVLLESMSEEERTAVELQELPHAEFVAICKNIESENPEKQIIVCKMLASSKKAEWKAWKKQKKGDWPNHIPKIRTAAESHNISLS